MEENMEHKIDHWETDYLWLKDPKLLQDNSKSVKYSLYATERRLEKDSMLKETYIAQWKDLIERGVAVKLSKEQLDSYEGPVYYLSHHEVIRNDSLSTPCRLVFNSSQKINGQCINDFWAKGPDLLNNPLGIVLRFREQPYALAGDIRKMFQRVKLKPGVIQNVHRCFWRFCRLTEKPDEYMLTTVTFGDRPAPTIAALALKKTAGLSQDIFPEAAQIIKENAYVDDIGDSFKSDEERMKRKIELSEVLKVGGFFIKKWVCSGDRDDSSMVSEDDCDSSLLGCRWNTKQDVLKIKLNPNISRGNPQEFILPLTKREALSHLSGCYDPNRFAAPIMIKGKKFMRNLWKEKVEWDDSISTEHRKDWNDFLIDILSVETISFKRSLRDMETLGEPMLIIFCDGSEQAYGAVAYIRWKMKNGSFYSRLVLAKCRIAPMKQISIVRLELNGAVIGKRLKEFICKHMRFKFERVVFLVDGQIGLIRFQNICCTQSW